MLPGRSKLLRHYFTRLHVWIPFFDPSWEGGAAAAAMSVPAAQTLDCNPFDSRMAFTSGSSPKKDDVFLSEISEIPEISEISDIRTLAKNNLSEHVQEF